MREGASHVPGVEDNHKIAGNTFSFGWYYLASNGRTTLAEENAVYSRNGKYVLNEAVFCTFCPSSQVILGLL
jgi:hypothetical protein